ncbi:MAG TPA: rhomboid family intramembrane serine protease [Gaiellaceae bacterium]|nr:rhomboid family intramembrane serine protease [Gaiellaceae bacterium]
MSTVETRYCFRHPDRETGLSCSDCGRPICADCATFAPVGIRCPDHAGVRSSPAARIKPRPVRRAPGLALATGSAPVTMALIAINCLIYLVTVAQGHSGLNNPGGNPPRGLYLDWLLFGPLVVHGGWYRLVTSMFLHGFLWHILFNMLALWFIGRPVEQYLGRARYIGLYFVAGLAGSAGALLQAPLAPTVGASGAIFGILGAMMIIEWQITGRLAGQAMTWIVINLVISFSFSGISWGGHVGGLIGGILVMLGYGHWGNRGRAQFGQLGLGGILGLVVVAAGSVAVAYFRVRGYA